MTTPIALTIAGSDSSGGAGIQADLKTFNALGVHGASVIVALTAQHSRAVLGVQLVTPEFVQAQFDAVVQDMSPAACKTGMLGSADIVRVVAECLAREQLPNYVLDPVLVSTSGHRLLDSDAELVLMKQLLPLASVVTPNLDEAEL